MPAVSLSEAAQVLGFRSRSTLYRLRDAGNLADYLLPPEPTGRQRLELEPAGLPPLREHVARFVRLQINSACRRERPRPDRRFEFLAGALTDALEPINGPQLTAAEAAALLEALPAAVAQALGADALQLLADAVAAELEALAPAAEPGGTDPGAFWQEYGRWEPDAEPLEGAALWENVAAMASALMGRQPPLTGPEAADLALYLDAARDDTAAGARWDGARWDGASARSLMEGWDGCPEAVAELRALVAGDRLPPDLQAAALELLAQAPAPEPLPVVVTG